MMPVTVVEIVYDRGTPRNVLYRGATGTGETIDYGPVITVDPAFDAEAYKEEVVRPTMNALLIEQEIKEQLGLEPTPL